MDEETKFLIESFFRWIDKALNTAEELLKDENTEFASETSLMICFSLLDTMAFSRHGKPLKVDHSKGEYSYREINKLLYDIRVSQPQIINFIKEFTKNANPPFFDGTKRAVYISTRDGKELYLPEVTNEGLFLLARNSLIHTGRNIGSTMIDTEYSLFPLSSTYTTDENGQKTKSRLDGIMPKATIKLIQIVAQQYKVYCTKNSIDPRAKINPVSFLFD